MSKHSPASLHRWPDFLVSDIDEHGAKELIVVELISFFQDLLVMLAGDQTLGVAALREAAVLLEGVALPLLQH